MPSYDPRALHCVTKLSTPCTYFQRSFGMIHNMGWLAWLLLYIHADVNSSNCATK
jgi:hypothetical protein